MIKKCVIYFSAITLSLYGLRYLHYQGLLRQETGYYAQYKTAFLKKNSYDVLFLGSSRVQMAYNPYLFDSLTHSNSFNLSMSGATPKIAYYALKVYLSKSSAPQQIYYEVDYHFLEYESSEIKDFNNYFPFLKDKSFRDEFSKVDPHLKLFYLLPYYSFPYTGFKNLSTGMHGWLKVKNRTDHLFYKGYFKENTRPHLNFIRTKPQHIIPNKTEMGYIDSIIQICKARQIRICLVTSPMFAGGRLDVSNKNELIHQLKCFAIKKDVSYYDLSSLPFCNQRHLFVDHFHLNYQGADLFTINLSKRIVK